MAHLWFRDHDDIWSAMPLNGHAVDISGHPPRELTEGFLPGKDHRAAVIPSRAEDSRVWILLVAGSCDVFVNGFAPVAGMRVLRDRDEIRTALTDQLFFSTETLAHVEEFSGGERPIYCARCRQTIEKGQQAVRCPRCSVWFHQTEQLPCWTYGSACSLCPQSTSLAAGFSWTPEA
jgi:hypothetical protein